MAKNNAINLRFELGSTDNALMRVDGTANDAMQAGSGATLDDNGRITSPLGANGGFYFGDGDSGIRESSDDVLVISTNGDALTVAADQNVTLNSTGALTLNTGTQAQRPGIPVNGMLRYETDTPAIEAYIGGSWVDVSSSGGSIGGSTGATDNAILRADGTGGSTLQNTGILIDDSDNISGVVSLQIDGIAGSFAGSEQTFAQAGVQTTDATVTQIAAVTLSTNESIVIKAFFNGVRSDHSEAVGGELVYMARRAGAGAIEVSTPITNILEDSSGSPDFDADVSGNDVRLLVQGEGSKTFNWVVSYQYHKVQTNA